MATEKNVNTKKNTFLSHIFKGEGKNDKVIRNINPVSPFSMFTDTFGHFFNKLIWINILMLICFSPVIGILSYRYVAIMNNANQFPFGSNLGVGYPPALDTTGMQQLSVLQIDIYLMAFVLLSSILVAAGLAGGIYCIRKMFNQNGYQWTAKEFFIGIKYNYFNALKASVLFFGVLYLCVYLIDFAQYSFAMQASGGMIALQVFAYFIIVFTAMWSAWILALGADYKQGFFRGFINGMAALLRNFPISVFVAAIATAPAYLVFINNDIVNFILMFFYVLCGTVYAFCVWYAYSQYVMDTQIGGKYRQPIPLEDEKTIKERRKAELATKPLSASEVQGLMLADGKSEILATPLKPIEENKIATLKEDFTKEDLQSFFIKKEKMIDSCNQYKKEHEKEEAFVSYNLLFENREKVLQTTDKKGKKKKMKTRMLNE